MADLDFGVAMGLAGSLMTIGHPWAEAALRATAMDLVKWCKGGIIDGRPCSPEQQALALVEYARTEWDQWPERGGTKALLGLFRLKFAPDKAPAPPVTESDLVARGILAAPCVHCPEGADHCEYGGEKWHARYQDEQNHAVAAPARARGLATTLTRDELQRAIGDEAEKLRRAKASGGVQ